MSDTVSIVSLWTAAAAALASVAAVVVRCNGVIHLEDEVDRDLF